MDLVLYHGGNCLDGFCAAWVVRQHFPDAEYVPCQYGDSPPDVTGRDVVIVDFSWKREQLLRMKAQAKSLVVLDHHKQAAKELEGLDFCIFDMKKSGARLAWEFFNDAEAVPWIVQYVEDGDLWTWKLPNSREIKAALQSYPLTWIMFDKLMEDLEQVPSQLIGEGAAILRFKKEQVDQAVKHASEIDLAGHLVLCANVSSSTLISDVGHELAKGRPFGVTWFERDGQRVYSLRSVDGGLDVSEIAKSFGGGGHEHAAGFSKGATNETAEQVRYDVVTVPGGLRVEFGRPVDHLELDRGSAMSLAKELRTHAGGL